jgi:DNA-binding CsgD family transcriptional regulator
MMRTPQAGYAAHHLSIGRAGQLIGAIGSAHFDRVLFDFLAAEVGIDHCTVFVFQRDARPRALVTQSATDPGRHLHTHLGRLYVDGAYLRDENIPSFDDAPSLPLYKIIDSTALELFREYRRPRPNLPGVRQELAFFAWTEPLLVYLGLYRGFGRRDFDAAEVAALKSVSDAVLQCIVKHLEFADLAARNSPLRAGGARGDRQAFQRSLLEALLASPARLTPREAQICADIMLGYSSFAIGERLGISPGTVATHRKHAYAKLGVCSQAELFGKYIDTLTG